MRAETDPRSIATSLIVGRPTDVLDIRKLEKKNMSPNRSGRCSKLQKSQIPEKNPPEGGRASPCESTQQSTNVMVSPHCHLQLQIDTGFGCFFSSLNQPAVSPQQSQPADLKAREVGTGEKNTLNSCHHRHHHGSVIAVMTNLPGLRRRNNWTDATRMGSHVSGGQLVPGLG